MLVGTNGAAVVPVCVMHVKYVRDFGSTCRASFELSRRSEIPDAVLMVQLVWK